MLICTLLLLLPLHVLHCYRSESKINTKCVELLYMCNYMNNDAPRYHYRDGRAGGGGGGLPRPTFQAKIHKIIVLQIFPDPYKLVPRALACKPPSSSKYTLPSLL